MCKKQTYSVSVYCSNCGVSSSVDIPRGTTVPYYGIECPNCGCNTASPNHLPKTPINPKKDKWIQDDKYWTIREPYKWDDPNRPIVTMKPVNDNYYYDGHTNLCLN